VATILIVDDLAAHREFLVTLLLNQGHRLLEASNGREALATARAVHPDLVITDVLMPVMNGYEFVKQLRLDPATARIPCLFYTAPYSEREARALAQSSGLPYVLRKPSEPDEVLRIVGRVLSGEPESMAPPDDVPVTAAFDREHLRLLTDDLSDEVEDLKAANARLRAIINIGLELASTRDPERLLQRVCAAAYDLFGATYVTLGILDLETGKVRRVVASGTDASRWLKPGDAVPEMLEAVVAEGRTVRGDNPGGDPAGLHLPASHSPAQAFLAAPITSPAHVHGWICLVNNEGRSFSADDERLLLALSGQVGRIYEIEHEVLERRQAESALREERDRAQRYLDTAEVILLALDTHGQITMINRMACDLLCWTESELLGRNWIDACLPADIRDAARQRLASLVSGDLLTEENRIVTRLGEERLIQWHNRPVRDDAGQVIGTLSSGEDITQRSRAVNALRTAEEQMRFACESTGVGIWDMDYTTGVLRWSGPLEAQYGLQPGTFGGTLDAFLERVHPEDRDALRATMAHANRRGTDFSLDHRAVWPDGTVRWLTGAGRVHLDEHGEPTRAVGTTQDVTERHSLEEQYYQAQKMEAMGRLAGGVAHDFNNLLTAILGYAEIVIGNLQPGDARRADVTEIQKAATSAAALTRQLLTFSRREVVQPTLLDVNAVVTGIQKLLGRLIGEDVSIRLALGTGTALVKADHGQLEQIIVNLAVNAHDAMPDGGTLTITTANVELDENYARSHLSATAGPYVALSVTDTGTGMTDHVKAHLFEPFFTTKGLGKGTGLGLATVDGIAAQYGGSVGVFTELGKGTSFTVYLPKAVVTGPFAEAPAPQAPTRWTGTEMILIVEDMAGVLELSRRILERQGYRVLSATNADEALQQFEREENIDVMLTDVIMPGVSGPQLSKQLARTHPKLKVAYMSGYTDDAIAHHGILEPGVVFLHKPFTAETLGRTIREAIDGHPRLA